MKGILANLLVKLGLDSRDFEQGMGKAKKETSNFASGMKALGGILAGVFAVETIRAFFTQLIGFAKESIKIENELAAAIRANGKDVSSTMADYKRFANEMQNVTTMEDDAILGLIRLAETLQSNAPKEAAKNAIALSKAIGVDLNTAVKMAVMAQSDMYTMLQRYVPALREASTASERAAEYSKLLAVGTQILTDEVNTNIGKAEQLRVKWDNIKEGWGVAILESKLMAGSIKLLGDYTEFYTSKQIKWWEKLIATIDVTGNVYKKGLAKIDLLESARKSEEGQRAYMESFTKSTAKIVKSEEQIAEEKEKALKILEKQNEEYNKQVDLVNKIADTQRKILSSIGSKAVNPEDFGATDANVQGEFGAAFGQIGLNEEQAENIGFDTESYKKKLEDFARFKDDFSQLVTDFGTDVVHEFGMAIGEMFATGDFPDDFGKSILAAIGGFISQLGKMLIGLGIASEAFQKLLASSFLAGGIPLIAAGAGLVLLGGAIAGFAKAGPKATGSTSGSVATPSYSRSTGGGNYNAQSQMNKVVFEIDGVKLKGVIGNVDRKYGLIR